MVSCRPKQKLQDLCGALVSRQAWDLGLRSPESSEDAKCDEPLPKKLVHGLPESARGR